MESIIEKVFGILVMVAGVLVAYLGYLYVMWLFTIKELSVGAVVVAIFSIPILLGLVILVAFLLGIGFLIFIGW